MWYLPFAGLKVVKLGHKITKGNHEAIMKPQINLVEEHDHTRISSLLIFVYF